MGVRKQDHASHPRSRRHSFRPCACRQEMCPPSASFFGFMGCASALVFACLGAAYGTAKSGVGVANMGVLHADMVMKSIIPIIMAGVLGIYGLIVAVLLGSAIEGDKPYGYASYSGYSALAAGLLLWYGRSLCWYCHRYCR